MSEPDTATVLLAAVLKAMAEQDPTAMGHWMAKLHDWFVRKSLQSPDPVFPDVERAVLLARVCACGRAKRTS